MFRGRYSGRMGVGGRRGDRKWKGWGFSRRVPSEDLLPKLPIGSYVRKNFRGRLVVSTTFT